MGGVSFRVVLWRIHRVVRCATLGSRAVFLVKRGY